MAIHHAHLAMLVEQGIVAARMVEPSLPRSTTISRADVQHTRYDGTCEDLFFYVERLIVERCRRTTLQVAFTPRDRATTST